MKIGISRKTEILITLLSGETITAEVSATAIVSDESATSIEGRSARFVGATVDVTRTWTPEAED
jgi:hypothetical protein